MNQMTQSYSAAEALEYARHHFPADDRRHKAFVDTLLEKMVLGADLRKEEIPALLKHARFLTEEGKYRVEFYYGISTNDLHFDYSAPEYSSTICCQMGLFDSMFAYVTGDSFKEVLSFVSWEGYEPGQFISQSTLLLQPGSYHLMFRLENPNGNKETVYRSAFPVDSLPDTAPLLSDIQLATDIRRSEEEDRFFKNGYFVKPFVGYSLPLKKPFYIYFEIYRLDTLPEGVSRYQIAYTLFRTQEKSGFLGLFGKKGKKVEVFKDEVMKTQSGSNHVETYRFDLKELTEDTYTLQIMVKDFISGRKAMNFVSIDFEG
jgi:hypothetical protein